VIVRSGDEPQRNDEVYDSSPFFHIPLMSETDPVFVEKERDFPFPPRKIVFNGLLKSVDP